MDAAAQAATATPPAATAVAPQLDGHAPTPAAPSDGADASVDQPTGNAAEAQDGDDQERAPTVAELREAHAKDRQVADYLAQQGYGLDHPVRAAAEAQAADAKRAWDAAKPGAAVTQRIVWAEKALMRARRNQSKMEQAIDDLDRDYELQRDAWMQQLAELRGRTREREEKLADISRQAAVEFRSPADGVGGGGPLRDAAETLEGTVTPAIEGLLAQIPADSPARGQVEQVVGLLRGVQGTVARASRCSWADLYDIADEDSWEEDDMQWQDHDGGWRDDAWHPARHDRMDGWYQDGWGQWRSAEYLPMDHGDAMDTTDVQVPTLDAQAARDPGACARADKRGKIDGDDPNGMQGRHVGGADSGTDDHANAARLQAAIHDAATAAASATVPAPPTPTAAEHAALERRRHELWDLAQDQGVEVTHQALAGMASEDLEEWATANLL